MPKNPLDLIKSDDPWAFAKALDADPAPEAVVKSEANPLDLVKATRGFSERVGSVVYKAEDTTPAPGFQGRHISDIAKAKGHKYISRKKVKGKWVYTYRDPRGLDYPPVTGPAPKTEPAGGLNAKQKARFDEIVGALTQEMRDRERSQRADSFVSALDMNNGWGDEALEVLQGRRAYRTASTADYQSPQNRQVADDIRTKVLHEFGMDFPDHREAGDKP